MGSLLSDATGGVAAAARTHSRVAVLLVGARALLAGLWPIKSLVLFAGEGGGAQTSEVGRA